MLVCIRELTPCPTAKTSPDTPLTFSKSNARLNIPWDIYNSANVARTQKVFRDLAS